MPWSTVSPTTSLGMASNKGMTPSPVESRGDRSVSSRTDSGDATNPYFSIHRHTAIGQSSSGAPAAKPYLNSTSDSFASSGADSLAFGSFGSLQDDELGNRQRAVYGARQRPSYDGSSPAAGFQSKGSLVPSARSEDVMGSGGLTSFSPLGAEPLSTGNGQGSFSNVYSSHHLAHNSISLAPQRPSHSPHPSFHSDTLDHRPSSTQGDLSASLNRLQLNDTQPFSLQQSSHRPSFASHGSYDAALSRYKQQLVAADAVPYNDMSAFEPAADVSLPYQGASRLSERDTNSPSDYNRGISTPFYSAATPPILSGQLRPSSGNRLPGHVGDGQAALLDRKLRGLQQEQEFAPVANPAMQQRVPFASPYDFTSYARGFGAYNPYYPIPHLGALGGAAAMMPRTHRDHDPGQVVRSPLLEEFRSNSKGNKRYELKDIYNHIVEFSGDQHGSRFIQQKLETANSDEKEQVFREIQQNSLQLMTDVFGNYVVQKLFEHGNQTQKKILANQMKGHVLALSNQMYGCRVVQKALEHILVDQQAAMVKELENHVMKCVRDQNGNHVIQKAIERVPSEHIRFIIDAFKGQVSRLATHPYGCRVIQRMLEHCEEADRESILAELHTSTASLIPDQFGNYVIQHVIENGEEKDRSRMIAVVISQVHHFSKHKFASNVVEKSIEFGQESQRQEIIRLLTTPNERGENPLPGLVRDQYGNYVIRKFSFPSTLRLAFGKTSDESNILAEKVLSHVHGAERERIVDQIKPLLSQLKKYSYGKQIVAIEKLLGDSHTPSVSNSSTTPPASHKSSPQPSRRSLTEMQGCRPPVGGAAPPTPPPTDAQSCHGASGVDGGLDGATEACKGLATSSVAVLPDTAGNNLAEGVST